MSSKLYYPPLFNALQKTLNADLNTGVTAAMTLNNTTGVQNKPGVVIVDRIDTDGNLKTTSVREWIIYQGTSGSTLTTLTRGVGNSTDQDHSTGAVVEFVMDITWAQAVIDALATVVNPDTGLPAITLGSDAAGDMYYLASGPSLSRLAKGGQGQLLLMNASVPAWSSLSSLATGTIPFYTGSTWTQLIPGTSGYVLQSSGPGQYPVWTSISGSSDGWTASSDTWTYASGTTFTISGVDRTSTFTKGTKIKFTQTTTKYFYVVSSTFSTNTTVTIAANDDYTLANAAITSPNYSYQEKPADFPDWFNFTFSYGGFSANPTPTILRYSLHGRVCYVKMTATGNGTSNATSLTITVPFAAAQSEKVHNAGRGVDNGGVLANPVQASLSSSSATVTFLKHDDSTWTNTGNKSVNFQFFFEI